MQTEILRESPPMPGPRYAARRERMRPYLAAAGLDCILITQAANRFYFSGFELHDSQANESSGCLIISRDGNDWLATDPRYEEAAAALWPRERTLIYRANPHKPIAALLCQCGATIGVEAKDISWSLMAQLRSELRRGHFLLPADGIAERLRVVKEPEEIAALRFSFKLNHQLLAWLEAGLAQGRFTGASEAELAWEIEKHFRENGAQELAFSTIVAAGANGALPHANPGAAKIPANGPLLIDLGCRAQDYCSDQTRSYWLGPKPDARFTEALGLARKAQEAAMEIMKPGARCSDVYQAAMRVFKKAGVDKAFTHGLGHGVGLQTHEAPSLSPMSDKTLEAGMAITVEPGLYYPGWGGVRWENTVLVEKDGVSLF